MTSLAFIGGGNMAGALIGGLIARGTAPSSIRALEIDPDRRRQLEAQYGIGTLAAPDASLRTADTVILAVKPQQLRQVCAGLRPHLDAPLVLSIAAGIRAADIARWLDQPRVVRAMPNTPVRLGLGFTAIAAGPGAGGGDLAAAERLFGAVGATGRIDEPLMDAAVSAVGSAPAYLFLLAEAQAAAAIEMGLDPALARAATAQTMLGAATMLAGEGRTPEDLRAEVTSAGGTTAAATRAFEDGGFRELVARAMRAARDRSRELGR